MRIVKVAREYDLPLVGRGAGTGLSGGTIATQGGIMIAVRRMNRILEIDLENKCAVVEPGVVNLDITLAVQGDGYYYAPDPSSQKACTIGGNVAENSGGPHTLISGVTTNHTLGLEAVLPDGTVITVGGKEADHPGYDLTGLLTGFGRDDGAGDEDHRASNARAGKSQDAAGDLRRARRCCVDGGGDHRTSNHSRRRSKCSTG